MKRANFGAVVAAAILVASIALTVAGVLAAVGIG